MNLKECGKVLQLGQGLAGSSSFISTVLDRRGLKGKIFNILLVQGWECRDGGR